MDLRRIFIVAVALVMATSTSVFPEASAQTPTDHSLSGRVCSLPAWWGDETKPDEERPGCHGEGLPGATVRLTQQGGTVPSLERSTQTDSEGYYFFENTPSGTFTLEGSRAGFKGSSMVVDIDGKTRQDINLEGQSVTVAGRVVNSEGTAIEGAEITFYTGDYKSVRSGSDGRFQTQLVAGYHSYEAQRPGYQFYSGYSLLDGQEDLVVELKPVPPQTSRITGQVTDQGGRPVVDARVSVNQGCCYDYAESPSSPSSTPPPGEPSPDRSMIAPRPYGSQNWTMTDAQGRYTIYVHDGWVDMNVQKEGYAGAWANLEIRDEETRTQDFQIAKFPDKTARVEGRVFDRATGAGLNFVSISIQSPEYGIYECSGDWEGCRIQLNADGTFSADLTPGYTLVSVWYEHYRTCSESQDADGSSQRKCGPDYLPYQLTLDLPANETTRMNVALKMRPAPDAVISGYVVDRASQTAIPGVHVSLGNQERHSYAWATTDSDGSYRLRVVHGYHAVSVWAEGYLQWQGVVDIPAGGDIDLDILLQKGEQRYGGCCIAYAEPAHASEDASVARAGGAPMAPSTPAASGQNDGVATGDDSSAQAFEDLGGGLGPYNAAQRQRQLEEDADGNGVPGPSAVLVTLALVAAALVAARRRVR